MEQLDDIHVLQFEWWHDSASILIVHDRIQGLADFLLNGRQQFPGRAAGEIEVELG